MRHAFADGVSEDQQPRKKMKMDVTVVKDKSQIPLWNPDKESIINGEKLTDLHIHFAQQFVKKQFPHLNGFQPTVLQTKKVNGKPLPNHLQVVHSHGDHWVVSSDVDHNGDEVKVSDSVFQTVDESTSEIIGYLFHGAKINLVDLQKQKGGADCGVCAIAIAYAIDPSTLTFQQAPMRKHLVKCYVEKHITTFPTL